MIAIFRRYVVDESVQVKLDQPYSTNRHHAFASAQLTDAWGTTIELTEGLNRF